jgi:signal transduction histidine kinase
MNLAARQAEQELAARRELFAVLAHEFRSPIGAILGFEELLSEGIFGEVSAAGRDALGRVRNSARQLLDLIAGLNDLSGNSGEEGEGAGTSCDSRQLLADALDAVQQEAAGRDTRVELADDSVLPILPTEPERAQRALRLTLMAAVKSTAGGDIAVRASLAEGGLQIDLEGTGLDAKRDDPEFSLKEHANPRLTGAGLRIAMARHALEPVHGTITLLTTAAGVILRLTLPTAVRE